MGISPLRSSFEKHPESYDETGKNLGMSNLSLFKKVHLPINKTAVLIAFILCFVDIIKELPITLILRPFNFDTLAVRTYEYAIEEMIAKSSIYSLVIILFGSVLLIFLRKIINKSVNESLSRTIVTSVTTFAVVLILFLFGGEVIHNFSFAMIIGVFVGTYSSIFIASPTVIKIAEKD